MTDDELVQQFKRQHLEIYKKAVQEIIKNNTDSLIEEDIFSLIKIPPLDSMDLIKSKLLSLAKKENLVLNTMKLNQLINNFRNNLKDDLESLKEIRSKKLMQKVDEFEPKRETEIITITSKELLEVNKNLKNKIKNQTKNTINKFESNLNLIYQETASEENKMNINIQFIKFMKGTYQKQLLESITMKILIKDRTLISGVIEQGERYLFTKTNSHIFDDEKKGIKK